MTKESRTEVRLSTKYHAFNGTTITYDDIGNPLSYNNGSAYTFIWDGRELASVMKGGVETEYTYGADGLRTQKQYGSTTYNYYYVDGQLVRMTWANSYIDFLYDESGSVYSFVYDGDQYYFVKNLQGDVVQIRSIWGTLLVEYDYDAWGNCTVVYEHSSYGDLAEINPIRYRGYFYDFETGFYYTANRFYDSNIGRFLNSDIVDTITFDFENFGQYNLYTYCWNNPVNLSDNTGAWPKWVEKTIAVAAVATVLVAATVVTVATCGAGSVAGVAMITTTLTIAARATEVTVLQVKKGKSEGKTNSQIAKDSMESIYDNGGKVIGATPVTKTASIVGQQLFWGFTAKMFGGKLKPIEFLKSPGGKVLAYGTTALAWAKTAYAVFSDDYEGIANYRGYELK